MQGQSKLVALPRELLLQIFDIVYHPWSLEIELRENDLCEAYHKNAIIRAVPAPPSVALLTTCKSVYEIAEHVMRTAFTGVVSSRDAPHMSVLKHILDAPRWRRIERLVQSLKLPNKNYSLKTSQDFIMLFPALETIELFEVIGFHIVVAEESVKDSDDDIITVPNIYFENQARPLVPQIPNKLPLICNGGNVELLVHIHFDSRRPSHRGRVIDILFRVASDRSLHVVDNMWMSRILRRTPEPMPPSSTFTTLLEDGR